MKGRHAKKINDCWKEEESLQELRERVREKDTDSEIRAELLN